MKKGKMIHSPLFSFYYLKAQNMAFSAVASKKVSKKAVIRNRNKRRLREIFRKHILSLSTTLPSGGYILFIKKDISDMPYPALFEAVNQILNKAL